LEGSLVRNEERQAEQPTQDTEERLGQSSGVDFWLLSALTCMVDLPHSNSTAEGEFYMQFSEVK
jgi:hypothetical protein